MSKNIYVVLYDFTPAADKAVQYALFLAKNVHTEIKLLHLAADKASGMPMVAKLEEAGKKFEVPIGSEIKTIVKVGSIFTDLGRIAKDEMAQLVIFGTHGVKGMQNLFGSNAMKVVTSVECPFLIVQKDTDIKDVENIIVPIDLTKESLQITNLAGDMASILKANLHVIAEKQTDAILNTRIQNRISIVSKQYEDRGMEAEIAFVKKGGAFAKKVMNYVKAKNGGMIALAYHSESLIPQFDTFAQSLLMNKECLPVMIVNSKLASALYF